jgi:GT2 family glycosyltransferase
MRVAVCISTFHRPDGLREVLGSIGEQVFPGEPPDVSVVVVNNDPEDREPAAICEEMGPSLRWPVVCLDEAERGLAAPRNRALEHAIPDHELVAFVDDDARADAGWLHALMTVRKTCDADVVTGPTVPEYEHPPEPWLERGGFFARVHRRTGERLDRAFTHNVLIRTEILRTTGVRFDLRFGPIGGEDTHFFRRLHRASATIVWADDAVVVDRVPAERMTPSWLVRRHWRAGMTTVAIERDLGAPAAPHAAWTLARAAAWHGAGAAAVTAGALGGKALRVRGRCWIGWARGLVAGLRGRSYAEYLEER